MKFAKNLKIKLNKIITKMITRRRRKEVNADPEYYKYLNPKITFNSLEPKSKGLFGMSF